MKAKIKINGKIAEVENLKKVSWLGKFTGLMFRKNSQALMFKFARGRNAIHSLFCFPFIAVWFLDGRVVDYKIVEPWKLSLAPESEFDTLIEIPINESYKHLVDFFVDKTGLIKDFGIYSRVFDTGKGLNSSSSWGY
ncbi:MAG: hypothetical protein KKB21_05200 [Nanoarchaeota archaeon]|nr:hypothetical protein [Nanoarchaeota archaeon]MBU4086943.1 hypothetical protein [Nanoarchaeota archaeon]